MSRREIPANIKTRRHFIYVGAAKCATTWLFEVLRNHPEIFVPASKDTEFFGRHYGRGTDWYNSFFRNAQAHQMTGEICHRYFSNPDACKHIQEIQSLTKILIGLRSPVDRLVSAYAYDRSNFLSAKIDFLTYCRRPEVREQSDYLNNAARFLRNFPQDQVRVFFFEDIRRDAENTLRGLEEFLEVSVRDAYPNVDRKVWSARRPRSVALAHLAYSVAMKMRGRGLYSLPGRLRSSSFVETALFRAERESFVIPNDQLVEMFGYYRRSYTRLEEIIGRPLPPEWHELPGTEKT